MDIQCVMVNSISTINLPKMCLTSFLKVNWLLQLILVCLPSCSIHEDGKQTVKEITVGKEELYRFPHIANADTLLKADPDSNMTMHMVNGRLCELYYKTDNRPLRLEIRDLAESTILYSYQSEADNLLMPFYDFSWNTLLIHDVLREKTVSIDLEKASTCSDFTPTVKSSNISAIRILPWGERQVFLNDYSYVEGVPRVRFSDRKWNYREKHNYTFNSANVVSGNLICDNKLTRIVYVPTNDNKIEILGKNGEKMAIMVFYHEKKQEVSAIENDNGILYAFRYPPVLCFSKACAGKDSFLAGYIDDDGNHYIAIIDWDGHLLGGIKVNGEIRDLSYEEDGRYIYSFERIDDHDYLIKYISPLR